MSSACCPQRPSSPFQPPAAGGSPCVGVWPCPRSSGGCASFAHPPRVRSTGTARVLSKLRSCSFDHLCGQLMSELLQKQVSRPQRSMAPGCHPLLTGCQGAPLCFPGTHQRGWGQASAVQDMQGSMFSPSPSAGGGSSSWPLGTTMLGGTWTLHDPGGGLDSSTGTPCSARGPCCDHSPRLSLGTLPQEHGAAPTQQAWSKEHTLPTATFLLLEVTRHKEPSPHATCCQLALPHDSTCRVGRGEGCWQWQAPPGWSPNCPQGFPCSLCDGHHYCCGGFALPAMSKR